MTLLLVWVDRHLLFGRRQQAFQRRILTVWCKIPGKKHQFQLKIKKVKVKKRNCWYERNQYFHENKAGEMSTPQVLLQIMSSHRFTKDGQKQLRRL